MQIKGPTALELLIMNENLDIPDLRQKLFLSKHGGMILPDYSQKPPAEFWRKVKKSHE